MSTTTIPVTLTLPPELVARVDAVAQVEERSRSSVVRRALQHALAERAEPPRETSRTQHAECSER